MIAELKSKLRRFDIEYYQTVRIENEDERIKKKKEILRKMVEMSDMIEKITERIKEIK